MAGKLVACVAVVGPDGTPLLVRKYCDEVQDLEIDALLFCSLDHFDPPVSGTPKKAARPDGFLGNVNTSDRFQIWGYRAPLRYKIIILTYHCSSVQESPMRALCEKVRDILFDALMDPFYTPFAMIDAAHATRRVDDAAASASTV